MNPSCEEALFALMVEMPVAQRQPLLDAACGDDRSLRQRVEALLAAHDQAAGSTSTKADGADRINPADEVQTVLSERPLTDEAEGSLIGRYKLLEKLGEGGFGAVWLAEQKEPVRRKVALKIIKLGMDTKQVIARFEAERQALAMMDHPNIAKVLDAGATDLGRPYFVMELVRGIRITEYCDQNNLTTKDRLDLFIKVCQAIQHAHQKGIIHRDIKPSNVMVTLHDGAPVPKVIDFGIAKATQGELTDKTIHTQFQQFIGTPAYMSPEQAEMSGLDIDTRADIYSLGVLLYELLVGSTPFDAKELMSQGIDAMRKTIREKEPVRPSTKLSQIFVAADVLRLKSPSSVIPVSEEEVRASSRQLLRIKETITLLRGDLDWIVMKCLEKDRTHRYETANGLAADLKRHLSNEPVVARPPTAVYRFQKAFRRNKLAFGAGAAVVAALVVGLTLAAIGWRQTRVERDKALQARTEAQASEQKAIEAGQRAHAGEQEARRAAAVLRRTAYVGDMALVHQAIGEGNLGRAKSLLARYVPKASEDDIRGFEWRHLWAQARSDEVARLGQYGGWIGGLAVSPDGIYLASAAPQGIEIRSLQNHALILALTNAGGGLPIQFSPDSQSLLTVRDSGLALWNTRTWKQETELPTARAPFAFAQNGKVIVAGQDDHLALWSTEKASKIADLPGPVSFNYFSMAMAISPDGDTVFFGDGSQIRSWDLTTHLELEPMSYPLGGSATFLAVSPEGLLAAAHWHGHVTLWDSKTRQLLHTFEDHLAWVSSVDFSPDGSHLASASADRNIFLYETRSRKLLRRFKGHEEEIWALQYSPDGHWLVSGSERDKSIRLWDVTGSSRGGNQVETTVPLRFVDSNRSLICVSMKEGFARMDLKTGTIQSLGGSPILSEVGGLGYRTRERLSVSPDGTRAATVLPEDRGLQIWSLLSGEREIVLTNSSGSISCVLFSEDGKRLATAGKGSPTRVWNTTDWSSEPLGESTMSEWNRLLAFSLNGSRLAQADEQGGMVFDLASRKTIFSFNADQIGCLAISQDGRFLAAGTGFNLIHLWNVNSGQKLPILRGHVSGLAGLSFAPDGKTLASCGDSRVKLWNIETVQEILTLARFSSGGLVTMFSSNGSALATSPVDGHGQLWRAPSFEEIAAAEAKEKAESKQP